MSVLAVQWICQREVLLTAYYIMTTLALTHMWHSAYKMQIFHAYCASEIRLWTAQIIADYAARDTRSSVASTLSASMHAPASTGQPRHLEAISAHAMPAGMPKACSIQEPS